ncbi:MAG: class I SAM-dependent methyltransferase [Methyloprofundus sp.]|nr:class I SAM-dependent methyltransferase [Methyloprofundus sp.]
MTNLATSNAPIWEQIYAGGHVMNYPDDAFVRLFHRLIKPKLPDKSRVLDYGFGSGTTSLHMAKNGVFVEGVEISKTAVEVVSKRFSEQGLEGCFQVNKEAILPFEEATMDALVAWQVLTYNNLNSMREKVLDMQRVLKKGGVFLAALSMPGSALDLISEPINDGYGTKEIRHGVQAGAKICIPSEIELHDIFAGLNATVGSVRYDFESFEMAQNSFWIVSFTKVE